MFKAYVRLKSGEKQQYEVSASDIDAAWVFVAQNVKDWKAILIVV